jgi:hypothetical protein
MVRFSPALRDATIMPLRTANPGTFARPVQVILNKESPRSLAWVGYPVAMPGIQKKTRIAFALLVALGLGAVAVIILRPRPLEQGSIDLEVAFKAGAGEAMFEGTFGTVVDAKTAGGGLEQLLAPPDPKSQGGGLLMAYQREPEKYKRYAELFDTAMTALKLGHLVQQDPATYEYPLNSTKIVRAGPVLDFWRHPYCVDLYASGLAIVSGGPAVKTFDCAHQKTSAEEINAAKRPFFLSKSGEVVVVVRDSASPKRPRELNKKGALSRSLS